MRNHSIFKILPLTLAISACSFIPDYQRPQVPLASSWVDVALEDSQTQGVEAYDIGWRDFFKDPMLKQLISTALTHNHDLRKAALNIELSQVQYRIQRTGELPTVGVSGEFTRRRTPQDLSQAGRAFISEQYNVGLGVSGFELDFFGRVRSQSESVLNKYLATQEARDSAQLSIVSAVAKTYYQARIAKASMDLAQKVLESRQESYRLAQLQFNAGVISAITLHGVEAQIETARANFAQAKRNYQQARNGLAVLIGTPIQSLDNTTLQLDLDNQFSTTSLRAGIPSQVLLHRPDIREAEYQLQAVNANIGAARAAFYPSIKLTGNAGFASLELDNLFNGMNKVWRFAPSISLPIFDAGRRQANLEMTQTMQKIAVEDYQLTVQEAFRDIADALVARQTLLEQYDAQQRGNAAVSERLRLENLRFENGVSSALDILDAQRESYRSDQQILQTELMILQNMVDLYTAMGGGLYEYSAPTLDRAETVKSNHVVLDTANRAESGQLFDQYTLSEAPATQ